MGKKSTTDKHVRDLRKARQSAEHLERLLLKSEARLQHSVGVETLERLAREIALYFKNILNSVTGYAHLLRTEIDQGKPHRKYVQLILSHAEMGKAFTESLLTFGASGSINLALLNINRFIDQVGQLLSVTIKKGIKLQTMLTERDVTVMADPVRIGQVFVSLVRYMSRAMSPEGTMTVLTRFLPVERTLDQNRDAGCVVLSIRSDDVASSRPASPSRTKNSRRRDIQLAFSAIRRIIKEHHGAIRIGGQRGKTMEFNIYLPVLVRV